MNVRVQLYPPLNNAAGQRQVEFALDAGATVQVLIDKLVERFGDEIHRFLFDNQGRIIPGWCAFINQRQPVYFNRPAAMRTPLADGDEIGILIALAGG